MPLDGFEYKNIFQKRREGACAFLLANVPKGQFKLTDWCGCFLGWLSRLEYDNWKQTYVGWGGFTEFKAAEAYFGISSKDAYNLFSAGAGGHTAYGGRDRNDVTLEEVCEALLALEAVDAV